MKIKQLKEIAFSIKDTFVCKGVSSMKIDDLLSTLEKKTGNSRDLISNTLKEFSENHNDFIKLYDYNSISFVKIDGSSAMESIITSIENKFK